VGEETETHSGRVRKKEEIMLRRKQHFKSQEVQAELFYQNQKKERVRGFQMNKDLDYVHINPNFPCFYGENVVGLLSNESIFDGHKYTCGLNSIHGRPIVYSFGSDRRQDFELGLYTLFSMKL